MIFRKFAATALTAISALGFSAGASAFSVTQDGLGIDIGYTTSGQTVSFTFTADFTGATTSWIGDTMDAFSIQFGNAANNSLIAGFTPTISGMPGTDTLGTWTGYLDKVSGQGCSDSTAEAICYTVNPTATGGDGASIIAADTYFWKFDVTFLDGVDVASVLDGNHSIKFLSVKLLNNGRWTTGSQLSQEGSFTDDNFYTPEPVGAALVGIGLLGMVLIRRRRA